MTDTSCLEGLNPRHRAFVVEFMKDRNATQAAIRAGYSEKSARKQASDIRTRPDVSAAIADLSSREEKGALDGMQGSKQELVDLLWGLARDANSEAARVSAIKALAPSYGLITEHSKVDTDVDDKRARRDVGDAELEAELRRRGIDPKAVRPSARTNVVSLKSAR